SGGNHQEKVAEGFLCRFPRLWQFPQASPSAAFFFASFSFLYSRLECPGRGLIRALASWKIASSFWSIFFDSSNGSCVLNVWSSCASFTPSACPHSRTRSSGVFGGS